MRDRIDTDLATLSVDIANGTSKSTGEGCEENEICFGAVRDPVIW